MKVWELIVGVICVVAALGLIAAVCILPTDVERLEEQNKQQAKTIKRLELADRAMSAGCEEARQRTIPLIMAIDEKSSGNTWKVSVYDQVSLQDQTLIAAQELSYWMKYCIPKGYLLHQKLVDAAQKQDLSRVREALATFRSGAVIVERNTP